MSVCGQSGQTEEDSASEEAGAAAREKPSDIYKQKPASKVVRVLTVLAYLLSVSLAAILLSVYYICVWKSPDLPPSELAQLSARRADHHQHQLHVAGGGDTAVNGSTSRPPENITSGFTNTNFNSSAQAPADETPSGEAAASASTPAPDVSTQALLSRTSDDVGAYSSTDSVT